jgi:hypothetical protein
MYPIIESSLTGEEAATGFRRRFLGEVTVFVLNKKD